VVHSSKKCYSNVAFFFGVSGMFVIYKVKVLNERCSAYH